MRMGVLDIGSNTGHLLVVDAFRGAPPLPALSYKEPLRLAEHLDEDGCITDTGTQLLLKFIALSQQLAEDKGCATVLAFATSAVRDAANVDALLASVREETGVELKVLTGETEAELTFLAVRRWFGWSSGRLGVFDIGGGSLEVATGSDELPNVRTSSQLGAGRLAREWLQGPHDAPDRHDQVRALRRFVRAAVAEQVGPVLKGGGFEHAVATSKTFRSLARLCGAAPSSEGIHVRRLLPHQALQERLPGLETMSVDEIATLPGVSPNRAHQILAGAIVADAVMDLVGVDALEICPWALREGVILEHLDHL